MKFTEVLKNIISEDVRAELFIKKFTEPTVDKKTGKKANPVLTKEELLTLIKNDPTSRVGDDATSIEEVKKTGGYVQWMINQVKRLRPDGVGKGGSRESAERINLFFEDLYKTKEDLIKFERFKGQIPVDKRDINKLTSDELYDLVKDFSLEKATTTKAERKDAKYAHPGGEYILETPTYVVTKITRTDALGKEAACFYGGNNKETRWCTSAPGLSHFDYYIGKGPLYVIYNPNDPNVAPTTGLPVERYQVNFETDSYMDRHDHRFDIVEKLNGDWKELKPIFKSKFAKGLTESNGTSLKVNGFNSGNVGKFIGLYGLEELINAQPDTLTEIQIRNNDKNGVIIKIPESITRFKNLELVLFDNCIDSIPDSICKLENLNFLSLMNNPQLKTVPECIADMPNLMFLNIKGSDNVVVPEKVKKKAKSKLGNYMLDFSQSTN